MTIEMPALLLSNIMDTLSAATVALTNYQERESKLTEALEAAKLLNETEAQVYLKRDAATLLYYRRMAGLPYYKCGRDVWYRKSDIDDWLASGYVKRRKQ